MSFVKLWLERFEQLLKEFTTEFENQRSNLSRVDKQLQVVLHELENVNISLMDGYGYAKRIQDLRLERRDIKDEYLLCQIVYSLLQEGLAIKLESVKNKRIDKVKLYIGPKEEDEEE